MQYTPLEVVDAIEKQCSILRYIAELEDKEGLSNILLEVAASLGILRYSKCLKVEEDKDVEKD